MEEIQSYYQIPSITHFCNLFRNCLDLPDFDYEDLEFAFLSNVSPNECDLGSNQINLIYRLICALLEGYFETHINHTNWEKYLQKLFQIQWVDIEKKRSPFVGFDEKGEEFMIRFDDLPIRTKVDVIHCLCDYRLFKDDISQHITDISADEYRVEPLGTDSKGCLYWYFYGTRLYRENPTVAQSIELNYKRFDDSVHKRVEELKRTIRLEKLKEEQELKKQKDEHKRRSSLPPKVLGSRTGLRDRKSEQLVPNGVCTPISASSVDSNHKKCENSRELKEITVSSRERCEAWSLVCQSEQDWKDLCQKFEKSKNKNEISFYKLLAESFVPKISEIFEKQERDKFKVERQKVFDLLPRRLSSRIELRKLQKEKEELEEEVTTRRQQEEAERKHSESDRQRSERIKLEREKRAQKRLALVEERADRAMKRDRMDGESSNANSDSQTWDQNMETNESQLQYISEEFSDIPVCPTNTIESFYEGLDKVIHSVKSNRDAWPFAEPVDGNKFPMYYQVIEEPIDLSIIEKKVENRKYDNFDQIENDIKLMVNNCETFNGPKNGYTLMAYGVWRAFKKASLRHLERELSYDESNAFIYPQKVSNTNVKHAIEAKKKKMRNKRRSTFKALHVLAKAAEKAVEANEKRAKRTNAGTTSTSTTTTTTSSSSSPRDSHSCDSNASVLANESSNGMPSTYRIHGDMLANLLFNANHNHNHNNANSVHNSNPLLINASTHENLSFKSLDEWSKSLKNSGNSVVLPQHSVVISSSQFTHCTNGPTVNSLGNQVSFKVLNTENSTNNVNTNSLTDSFTSVIPNNENARKELTKADPKRLVIKLSRCESGEEKVWKPVTLIRRSTQNNFNTISNSINSTIKTNGQTIGSTIEQLNGLQNIPKNCVSLNKRFLVQDFNSRLNDKLIAKTEPNAQQMSGLTVNTNNQTLINSNPISPTFQITGIQHNKSTNLKVYRLKMFDQSSTVDSNSLQTNQNLLIPKVVLMPLDKATLNGTGLSSGL